MSNAIMKLYLTNPEALAIETRDAKLGTLEPKSPKRTASNSGLYEHTYEIRYGGAVLTPSWRAYV